MNILIKAILEQKEWSNDGLIALVKKSTDCSEDEMKRVLVIP